MKTQETSGRHRRHQEDTGEIRKTQERNTKKGETKKYKVGTIKNI